MSGTITAVQPDGEHLHVETWVYQAWIAGTLKDPQLKRILDRAVCFAGWDQNF